MCIAIPMRISRQDGCMALCEARGVERRVNLVLLLHALPAPGDWVLVHQGCAQSVVSAEEAARTWEILDLLADPAA